MANVNLTAIEYFLPIISFLLVFVVVFAVLVKTKILGESKFTQLFVAFLVASVFVTAVSAREFILQITPWFAIFVVVLVILLAMTGFVGDMKTFTKGIGVVLIIGLLIVFLISAFSIFAPSGESNWFINWIKSPAVYGAIILLALGALVSWVLVKNGGK